jgi:hypothetical protein
MKVGSVQKTKGKFMVDLMSLAIQVIVGVIIVSPILWLVGRAMVGKQKAKFTDAIWIVALGIIIWAIIGYLSLPGWVAAIVMVIVWLALIKHFFDCGWLKALLIAIVALVIFFVIAFVLALVLGFTLASVFGFTLLIPLLGL